MNDTQTPNTPYGYNSPVSNMPNTPNSSSKFPTTVIIIVSIVLSVAALILGAIGLIQAENAKSEIASFKSALGFEEGVTIQEDGPGDTPSCTPPTNIDQIVHINLVANNGDNEYYIEPGLIESYTNTTDTSGKTNSNNTSVETDTSDILQYLLSNGLSDFSNYEEEGEENWAWSAEFSTTENGYCLAKGTGSTPTWFNTLIAMANNKIK